jgi:hypothetical protein
MHQANGKQQGRTGTCEPGPGRAKSAFTRKNASLITRRSYVQILPLLDTRVLGPTPSAGAAVVVDPSQEPGQRTQIDVSKAVNVEHKGQTIANAAQITLGSDHTLTLYTQSGTHLICDVSGWYTR